MQRRRRRGTGGDVRFQRGQRRVAPATVAGIALRKVPLGPLLPALLTGEPFGAEEALRLGFVAVVTDDSAAERQRLCETIAAGGPEAVAATKAVARHVADAASLDPMLAELEQLSGALSASPEAAEGMTAFAERRPPHWPDAPQVPRAARREQGTNRGGPIDRRTAGRQRGSHRDRTAAQGATKRNHSRRRAGPVIGHDHR